MSMIYMCKTQWLKMYGICKRCVRKFQCDFRVTLVISIKTQTSIPSDPVILLQGIYPEEISATYAKISK